MPRLQMSALNEYASPTRRSGDMYVSVPIHSVAGVSQHSAAAAACVPLPVLHRARMRANAKVCQLYLPARREQDVPWFHVAVDDLQHIVKHLECACYAVTDHS
eukprot:CAMPEP_0181299864 /NCGR_PEP_ID=MMETSP1101-20121128/6579_1 /TAXON_ID=46948 /ORGANISM="Rhodomonas abbreviata, Strain Caron Lab Isolate" /LENGTH=102 /DNA_ID=CAMNT_0023405053 /DNA_START=506 /DNA_END=813 /DNA_ORIENTATION=+